MNSEQLQALESTARAICDQTRYPYSCPKWLRPLLHVFRLRDINRAAAQTLEALTAEIARQSARIRELEAIVATPSPSCVFKPRILLDVTCTNRDDNRTGIQRVVRNLARECVRLSSPETEILPVKLDSGHLRRADDFLAKLGLPTPPPTVEACLVPRPSDILVILDGGWSLRDQYDQVMSQVRAHGGIVLGIIYDLIPLNMPHLVPPAGSLDFRRWLDLLLTHCSGFICISQTVAGEVQEFLNGLIARYPTVPPVVHFHLGGSPEDLIAATSRADQASKRIKDLRKGGQTLFVMVGSLEKRKGHDHALDALDLLWAESADVVLVLVGSGTWTPSPVANRIRHHPMSGKGLHWLTGCDDAELHELYATADALLFASLAEGFGLPLVEAAQAGLPIICSDIPIFREVCGSHATFYPSGDGPALAETIRAWLRQKTEGRVISSRGMPYLTWRESAEQLLDAINRVTGSAHQPATST